MKDAIDLDKKDSNRGPVTDDGALGSSVSGPRGENTGTRKVSYPKKAKLMVHGHEFMNGAELVINPEAFPNISVRVGHPRSQPAAEPLTLLDKDSRHLRDKPTWAITSKVTSTSLLPRACPGEAAGQRVGGDSLPVPFGSLQRRRSEGTFHRGAIGFPCDPYSDSAIESRPDIGCCGLHRAHLQGSIRITSRHLEIQGWTKAI